VAAAVALFVAGLPPLATQADRQSLESLLRLAAEQVEEHARVMAETVVEEDYQQIAFETSVTTNRWANGQVATRRTRADLIVLRDVGGSGAWVPFRDVFEVDGRPVRDRDERLARVLSDITDDSIEQAVAITREGARFNLDGFSVAVDRTINSPMTALLFLRAANQARVQFRPGAAITMGGVPCRIVAFSEGDGPSLIASPAGARAKGRFWIAVDTGRVVRSELEVDAAFPSDPNQFVRSRVTVTYAPGANGRINVPMTMDESYELNGLRRIISGRARYSNFRRFGVDTSEQVR
jgi:hypothetical protein